MTYFDNHDPNIPYFQLMLEGELDDVAVLPLPDGFHFAFYRSGDRDHWIEIERSARELESFAQGVSAWKRYYTGRERDLETRMLFVENQAGEKVATATAFYDITGRDRSGSAWLHWVAVKREYQGRGLAKPLISRALSLMKSMGYSHAKIPTQTTTWLAVKLYLGFGFRPIPENAASSSVGWSIMRELTRHPSLDGFARMADVSLIDISGGVNEYQYQLFDAAARDLAQYQSRMEPARGAPLLCWCYICCDCRIVGSIWMELTQEGRPLLGIFIADEAYRGKGVGRRAILLALEKTRVQECFLHVRGSNLRAIRCYHRAGFSDVRRYEKENGIAVIEMKYPSRSV